MFLKGNWKIRSIHLSMNFYLSKYHLSEKARYRFIIALLILSSMLLSMNIVVAQDRGYAKTSKIYKKRVKPEIAVLSPRLQCDLLKKKKYKNRQHIIASSKRRHPKSKKMAEGGSL